MKGIQRAFDGKPHRHQPQRHHQRDMILMPCRKHLYRLFDIAHQKLPGDGIEMADTQKQQAGTQKAHNHVPDSRLNGTACLPYHNQPAGRDCVNLHEYICRKQVIGIYQRQQGAQQ